MQLLSNTFQTPSDGWYQISALGEFPHKPSGLTQIVDDTSCRSMVQQFRDAAATPNFAGLLIDFDHFSLEGDKPSEAAGWITSLEQRPDGIWAQIRWSDSGQQAVTGGRYRFISPVWKQDECEVLGNNRVRPLKLLNAAVTNDPNIRGMMPLSNRTDSIGVNLRPSAVPLPVRRRTVALANRTALHFVRGLKLANAGMYTDPKTGQRREWVGGRPWGRGGSRSSSSSASTGAKGDAGAGGEKGSPGNVDDLLASLVDPTNYDPAQNGAPNIRPLGDASSSSQSADTTPPKDITFQPVRETETRIKAIEQQRDALIAQRPVEPKPPDFSVVDTRKLAADMMKTGKGTNEITAAVKAAQAQNIAHKAALERIKHDIRKAYPNDKAKQSQALSKYTQQLNATYQRQHDAWQKVSDQIDAAVAKSNAMIEQEKARGAEDAKLAAQKTQNAAATRGQKLTDAQTREQLKQVAADKADARRKAAADAKAQKTPKVADDLVAYRREMSRRQFYWDSLARGEKDAAKSLYPKADIEADVQTLKELAPPSKSKANSKAHKAALAELAKQAPASPATEQIP